MGSASPGSVEHLVRPDPTEVDVDHKASLQGKRCSLWESQPGDGVKSSPGDAGRRAACLQGPGHHRAPPDLHSPLSALRAPEVTQLIHGGPLTRGDA